MRLVSQGSAHRPVSVLSVSNLDDLRRLRKVRVEKGRQSPDLSAVQMRMRMVDAYACAYEIAKYLADARACDKLGFVSPGGHSEQIQTGVAAMAAGPALWSRNGDTPVCGPG